MVLRSIHLVPSILTAMTPGEATILSLSLSLKDVS